MTTTMRERFDNEFSNRQIVGDTILKDFRYLYPDLIDFIEQELKKEREEIEGIVCHQLSLARYGNDDDSFSMVEIDGQIIGNIYKNPDLLSTQPSQE